jgi:hypothetical protein
MGNKKSGDEQLEFDWPDTGRLNISIHGNEGATLHFIPRDLEKLIVASKQSQIEATPEVIPQHQDGEKTIP